MMSFAFTPRPIPDKTALKLYISGWTYQTAAPAPIAMFWVRSPQGFYIDSMAARSSTMIITPAVMFSIDHPKLRIALGTVSSSMVWDPESRLCLILIYLDPASLVSAPKREGRLVSTNIWLGQGTLEEKIKEQKNNTQVRKNTWVSKKIKQMYCTRR